MNRREIIGLKALGGIDLRIIRNTRFMLLLAMIAVILLFFGPTLFTVGKGYINHFFTNMIKPEIQKDGRGSEVKIDDDNKNDGSIENYPAENDSIENLSERFVRYCFARNEKNIKSMLADNTFYIKSPDGSSFLRYIEGEQHVEGYMATDKNLFQCRQRWFYTEDDTAISGMEIILEGNNKPLIWYLYYKKQNGLWKLFMLENE